MISHPILFSDPMIKAILEDRKTQTRRIVKPQLEMVAFSGGEPIPAFTGKLCCPGLTAVGINVFNTPGNEAMVKCPYGKPGDRLWVREAWYWDQGDKIPAQKPNDFPVDFYYRADGECCEQIPECECGSVGKPRWHPGIHMPRWASRITLEITGVKVERLQEISEEDAKAEGVNPTDFNSMTEGIRGRENRIYYADLWTMINGPGSWRSNPFVWAIAFKKL